MHGAITKPSELTYANANNVGGFSSAGDNLIIILLQIRLKLSLLYIFCLCPQT